jgi:hypothetical protein
VSDIYDLENRLKEALDALMSMWNQYCPPPMGHACMSAGEDAEEVLEKYGLLKPDGNPDWNALERLEF